MDGGAWWAAVHGVTKSRTWLSDFTFTFHFQVLEKEMATHSSILAWRIPGTGEAGRLPSMGSHRIGHNWSDLAAAAAAEGYSPWGGKESDMTEWLTLKQFKIYVFFEHLGGLIIIVKVMPLQSSLLTVLPAEYLS